MGYELPASSLSEIKKNGKVEFLEFVSEEQIQILSHHADRRDSFQSCPLTKKILTARDLGKLLNEIVQERPIKLIYSNKLLQGREFNASVIPVETVFIGIFFPFDGSPTLFFMPEVTFEAPANGLVVLYGDARARFVPKDEDPDAGYFIKKGYAGGDKLKATEYPLVFK